MASAGGGLSIQSGFGVDWIWEDLQKEEQKEEGWVRLRGRRRQRMQGEGSWGVRGEGMAPAKVQRGPGQGHCTRQLGLHKEFM